MKFLFAIGILMLFMASWLFIAPYPFRRAAAAPASDFEAAVQAGLQSLSANSALRSRQQEIQNQDYKSTWDEFGVNAMVDGAASFDEINNQIMSDISQSAQAAQNYNQQEANYLQMRQITPEQVQSIEQTEGIDLPPQLQFDPNPSINENPEVNISSADVPVSESGASSTETGIGNTSESTSASGTVIFNAILQEEQMQIASSTETTSTTAPSDAIPSDIVPSDASSSDTTSPTQ